MQASQRGWRGSGWGALVCVLALLGATAGLLGAAERAAVILDNGGISELRAAMTALEEAGLQVEHVFPPRVLIGRLPAALDQRLLRVPGVARVHRGPVAEADCRNLDPLSGLGLQAYDLVFGAGRDPEVLPFDARDLGIDALVVPPEEAGGGEGGPLAPPGFNQTSEFLGGEVVVGLILPESNGVAEPSTEDWSAQEVAHVAAEVMAGLDFYAAMNQQADITWIYHFSDAPPPGGVPGTVECDYEAILHGMFTESVADSFFAYLGYPNNYWMTTARQYDNDLRALYGADWAYMVKIADDTSGQTSAYTDGTAAAWVTGPATSMSYTNGGYGPDYLDGVLRHETIHIFGAMDEYTGFYGCPSTRIEPHTFWGYLAMANANSQCCDGTGYQDGCGEGEDCIGWNVLWCLNFFCPYTRGQLGWLDDDGDGLPNPQDTFPATALDPAVISGGQASFSGVAEASSLLPERDSGYYHTVAVAINRLSGVEWRLGGRTWMPAGAADGTFDSWQEAFTFTTPLLPNGTYEVEVRAIEGYGNREASFSRQVFTITGSGVRNSPPFARFASFPPTGSTATSFRFDATTCGDLTDKTDSLKVRWDFEGDGIYDTTYSTLKVVQHTYPAGGHYTPRVQVKDVPGAASVFTGSLEVLTNDLPPVAAFSVRWEDVHGVERPGFVFDSSASYDAETPAASLAVRWDWQNDGVWDTEYGSEGLYSHAYPSLGTGVAAHSAGWTVRLEVRDGAGQTATTTQYVWANAYNHAPVAEFSANALTGVPGQVFTLDATASYDPDEGQSWEFAPQYRWDFDGDGTFETDFEPTYVTRTCSFIAPGVYPATLEVKDRYHALSRFVLPLAVSLDGLNTPPVADFTIHTIQPWEAGIVGGRQADEGRDPAVIFAVNASISHDAQDPLSILQVRWDWENDGTWDTPFSTVKTASHSYPDTDNPTIVLEVRDSGGLIGRTAKRYLDLDAPLPPMGFTAVPGPLRVNLSWFANSEPDLAGYRVYRKLPGELDFGPPLADVGLETSYVDFDVVEEGIYIYAVTAYDSGGLESNYSDSIQVDVPDLTPPAVPAGLMSAAGDTVVHLRWEEVTDPDFWLYWIYRRVVGEPEWTLYWFTYTGSYSDGAVVNGTTYEYSVASSDEAYNESEMAEPVTVTPRTWDEIPPPPPGEVWAFPEGEGIWVNWDRVMEEDVYLYRVQRRELTEPDFTNVGIAWFNEKKLFDDGVVSGVTYCYRVIVYDTDGNESEPSKEACATAP